MIARKLGPVAVACLALMSSILVLPVSASAPVITPLADITSADQGKQVTVQGSVVGTENFSSGFKLAINDGTAQVVLLVWADDWDYVYDSYHLNTGSVVSVTGKVDVYNKQIEIIPDRGRDLQVLKKAKRDERIYDLGALTGNDHNAVVSVEGTIADIQPFAGGTYLLVTDHSGAQKVKLYDVVMQRVPRKEKLAVGLSVSIVGRVRAKRRVGIEIVVALPHDVYVNDSGSAVKDSAQTRGVLHPK